MIKIRSLERTDEKQLLSLAIHFFKDNQRGKIVSKKLLNLIKYKNYDEHVKEDVKGYMKLDKKEAIIFVAEDDRNLIGYIYGRVVNKSKMVFNKIGIIEDWFVEEEYRDRGIGETLWNRLISWFRSKKCNKLELDVYTTNKHAIEIYRKLGFFEKVIVMTKKL